MAKLHIATETPWQVYFEYDAKPACVPVDGNNAGYTLHFTGEVWVEWQGQQIRLSDLNTLIQHNLEAGTNAHS